MAFQEAGRSYLSLHRGHKDGPWAHSSSRSSEGAGTGPLSPEGLHGPGGTRRGLRPGLRAVHSRAPGGTKAVLNALLSLSKASRLATNAVPPVFRQQRKSLSSQAQWHVTLPTTGLGPSFRLFSKAHSRSLCVCHTCLLLLAASIFSRTWSENSFPMNRPFSSTLSPKHLPQPGPRFSWHLIRPHWSHPLAAVGAGGQTGLLGREPLRRP